MVGGCQPAAKEEKKERLHDVAASFKAFNDDACGSQP